MAKSLVALAALIIFVGSASAQSNVTLYGVVDLSGNYIKNGSKATKSIATSQLASSRLGFKGSEDLGGGLAAGFLLEASLDPASGYAGGAYGYVQPAEGNGGVIGGTPSIAQGQLFNRQSILTLTSRSLGEVRMGRDYAPTFWIQGLYDVNGTNGLGAGYNLLSTLGSGAGTTVRVNNAVEYVTPDTLGGAYGYFMGSFGEGLTGARYDGGRIGYRHGAFDGAIGYGQTRTAVSQPFKIANIGASYDFGVAKLFALGEQHKWGDADEKMFELSLSAPFGASEVRASIGRANFGGVTPSKVSYDANGGNHATMFGLGYIYNLSKRTALYTTAGYIKDDGKLMGLVVLPQQSVLNTNAVDSESRGVNLGMRHAF
jgi:predicted porin